MYHTLYLIIQLNRETQANTLSRMSTELKFNCWKCTMVFKTNRERKNHMANREHGALRVVCPSCPRERLFRRSVPELRDHYQRDHPKVFTTLSKEFFSESNGFWLSINPADYLRIVSNTARSSDEARKAREMVRGWFDFVRGNSTKLKDFERGWDSASNKRDRAPTIPCESSFVPDYEGTPPPKKVHYDPENPSIEQTSLSIHSIVMKPVGFEAFLLNEERSVWYKCSISPNLSNKAMTSLFRRVPAAGENITSPPEIMTTMARPDPKLESQISGTLGIPVEFLMHISRALAMPVSSTPVAETDSIPSTAHADEADDPANLSADTTDLGHHELPGENTVMDINNNNRQDLQELPIVVRDLIPDASSSANNLVTNIDAVFDTPAGSLSPALSLNVSEYNPRKVNSDKEGVLTLFKRGIMPILPPAKRDWRGVTRFQLNSEASQQPLFWPPQGWEQFSPDQKLFALETMAFQLNSLRAQTQNWDRTYLIAKYQMLSLPGSARPPLTSSSKQVCQMRHCNEEMIKKIVNGNVTQHQDVTFIKMMEATAIHRENDTDWISDQLDQ
ncbi:uncharacterized protein LOC126822226 isoform X1 [Patella vulgata]|uniref:uncharacterized protein LOC126822226 isoform X1 n=1 Tax=Patella vulgata TaxID=6465 RepID=UPI0024A9AA24|nr:uncharacterized protein LOC126822226 isoform X1 [Patella vulgata]